MTSYYRDDIGVPEMGVVGRELWRQSGLGPADIQTAVLYDHFTPYVLMQLEELGFCGRGEAPDFIPDGAIELGGRLPLNTHGGQLGEAYIHGMNGIAEAVRQVRGTSVNQVDDVANVLVTAGTGVPTSGLILSGRLSARNPERYAGRFGDGGCRPAHLTGFRSSGVARLRTSTTDRWLIRFSCGGRSGVGCD